MNIDHSVESDDSTKPRTVSSAFPYTSGKQLGYRPDQVDSFLERARDTFEQSIPQSECMTSVEIRHTAFKLKRQGYSARHVDAALDRLEEVFYQRERTARMELMGEDAFWAEVQQLLSDVRGRIERERGKRFSSCGIFRMGYRRSQVDAFLDRIALMFAGKGSLSAAEVRGVVFHAQWRGYDEDQVDALLDAVIELILATD